MNFSVKKNSQQGFTLLEIMLVILLIGIASSAVVMTLPSQSNKESDPQWQADRFITLLQLVEDEALMTGREFGLVLKENSYQFTRYDYKQKKWLAIDEGIFSKERTFSKELLLKHTLTGSVWDQIESASDDSFIKDEDRVHIGEEKKQLSFKPQVFIMSSGETTPFSLEFSENSDDNKINTSYLSVDMSGDLSREKKR